MKRLNSTWLLFSCAGLATWGLFAVAQEATPRDPCARAPTPTQVETAVRDLPEATRAVTEPLAHLANRIRDDHELRTEGSALQMAAGQILRFTREANELSASLSDSAAQGRPTPQDSHSVYVVRRLLNRADNAFTLILTTWPDFTSQYRPVFIEYSNALRPYRELTYKIAHARQCNPSGVEIRTGRIEITRVPSEPAE